MKKSMLGVIDATMLPGEMGELAIHRSPAAIPFAGRYRLVDFVLSNMVNSGIQSVAIFPCSPYRSLIDHLGSGKDWDLNRKRDGLFFFPAQIKEDQLSRMAENIDYFERSEQKFVLISSCTTVANIDFVPALERFINQKCDLLEITHKGESTCTYILSLHLLMDLIKNRNETGYTSVQDAVNDQHSSFTICQYEYNGFLQRIRSIKDYYKTSMELLEKDKWSQLFNEFQPIFTKVKDEPPTKYTSNSSVTNSMIANGCNIEGEVNHSIVFRAVHIGKGSTVQNCIVMQKTKIGSNCVLEHVIFDKDVIVEDGAVLRGTPEQPLVVKKGSVESVVASS
ncbi:GlgC family sugar phosphate nucleotidyltransferase [Domibacillus epiphyticus]|uniref:Glucose-1-phosphate adenylyltransferase n=1 Tax=Domibacillus epiphyticus TaxID=1714355 RepID=A0A1V2A8P6_9BACI|nr:glucose-1-phosphate adenylyltransferase [Domibacillus epiphyticus]OMP67385.1 glucose-1-phosphate adenylyltransferase [Domibacillus epiphyticus]